MVFKRAKRILAVVVAGVLVTGASFTAFAAEGDGEVDGTGAVEYDNSEAVEYDKVVAPIIKDSTAYNFTLDPNDLLHTYKPSEYDGSLIYFTAQDTPETVSPKDGVTLYEKVKQAKTATSGAYADVAKTLNDAKDLITELEDGPFYVWAPNTENTEAHPNYDKGYTGEFVALTAENINNYFVVADGDSKTIKAKQDYKAMPNTFDGNLYIDAYVAIDGNKIEVSAETKLTDYGITTADGKVTAATGVFKDANGTAVDLTGDAPDLVYAAATTKAQSVTDKVYVQNKSRKAKTIKAVVTMTNTSGITFNASDEFGEDDESASMYVAATNGLTTGGTTAALVASEDGATAKATYTLDLAAPTTTDITYMDTSISAVTGGHNYYRYEAHDVSYNSDSFYLTAAVNEKGADAWEEWASKVTADTKPKFNIVYTVTDKITAPTVTETSVSGENNVIHYTVPTGVAVDKVERIKADGASLILTADSHYWVDKDASGTIEFLSGVVSSAVGGTIKVYFDDDAETVVTLSIVADE